jgi:arylsulfate sulfotransferase
MSVSLSPSVASPAPLGTVITWSASVSHAGLGSLECRFRTRYVDQRSQTFASVRQFGPTLHVGNLTATLAANDFRTVEDYGPNFSFNWSTIDEEGEYEIEASVRNRNTGATAVVLARFELAALAGNDSPVITPTSHPLVFIYSAPPCPAGSSMRVQIQSPEGFVQSTPAKACDSQSSMNFYLAGMRAQTPYVVHHVIGVGSSAVNGPPLTVNTVSIPIQPPAETSLTGAQIPTTDGILLQSLLGTNSIATDLSGNIVWYGPNNLSTLTRPVAGGTFMGTQQDGTKDPSQQFVREFDLLGNTVAETNAARINEQLTAIGMHPINAFHHEARKLATGGYLVLANTERILNDIQGPGPVDVIGDMILVLDPNLQLTWAWDAFDHLDPHRMAILGETCSYPANSGCSPFYLAHTANDWLHGNSLELTPDGNILYSIRHQDWIIKIDYENGAGAGQILWRLGLGGDFQIKSSDLLPWFSHQHDANFLTDGRTLTVFDDGNTREASDPSAHSRGQVLSVDEPSRTATLVLNSDLGGYSYALGSAQLLPNGNYHFNSGAEPAAQPHHVVAQSLEVDRTGNVVYGIQFGTYEYRSFRMTDLYTQP